MKSFTLATTISIILLTLSLAWSQPPPFYDGPFNAYLGGPSCFVDIGFNLPQPPNHTPPYSPYAEVYPLNGTPKGTNPHQIFRFTPTDPYLFYYGGDFTIKNLETGLYLEDGGVEFLHVVALAPSQVPQTWRWDGFSLRNNTTGRYANTPPQAMCKVNNQNGFPQGIVGMSPTPESFPITNMP